MDRPAARFEELAVLLPASPRAAHLSGGTLNENLRSQGCERRAFQRFVPVEKTGQEAGNPFSYSSARQRMIWRGEA